MYAHIHGNLFRQLQGFKLLCSLLNEEFEGLTARHLDDVATLEFSIHELMRQLFVERQKLEGNERHSGIPIRRNVAGRTAYGNHGAGARA